MLTPQTQGDFLAVLFRPLLSPGAAAWLLQCSTDHVVRMCEELTLKTANIAVELERPDAGFERQKERMLRILRASVDRVLIPAARGLHGRFTWAQALGGVLHPSLTRRQVAHFLDCSETHVERLTAKGLLKGPKLSTSDRLPFIAKDSLLEFLETRDLANV